MASKRKLLRPADDSPIDRWQTVLVAALVALIVAQTFVPEDPGAKMGHGAPFIVLWLMLTGVWLFSALRHDRWRLRFDWPDALVAALVGWYAVSAIVAIRHGSPRPAMNALCDWTSMGLTFLLVRKILCSERDRRAVVTVMLGLACGMSAVAVYQYVVTIPADLAAYDTAKHSTEALYEQTGQWLPPNSTARARFEARLESRLPGATYALSNSLAGFLVPWLVVLAGIMGDLRPRKLIVAAMLAVTLIVTCLWLTGSRTAGIAAVFGLTLVALERASTTKLPRAWWATTIGLIGVILVAAGAFVASGLGSSALDAAWRSLKFRIEYWQATWAIIQESLLLGCGPGQFQDAYTVHKLVGAAEEIQDPHNWFLEVWATAGTPAAILLMAALGLVIVRTMRSDRVVQPLSESVYALAAPDAALFGGLLGVVLGIALAWLTGFPISRMNVVLFAAVMVAVWFLFGGWVREGVLARRLPLIAALAMLVNLLAAGGIGMPGVADSLWLLLAISLQSSAGVTDRERSVPGERSLRWASGLAVAALLGAAIWVEYLPVVGCRLQLMQADDARAAGQPGHARDALEAAVAADPWSNVAANRMANQRFANYEALRTTSQQRNFTAADTRARNLAPRNYGVWAQSADYAAAIYRHTHRVEDLKAAERYYAQALALYPTNSALHAEAAKFWQSADMPQRASAAAAEALRLNESIRAAGHVDLEFAESLEQEMKSLVADGR